MKSKLKVLVTLALCVGLAVPSFSEDADKELRKGTCFCDGETNCRKKTDGSPCTDRDACSALACVDMVVKFLAGAAALDQLSK